MTKLDEIYNRWDQLSNWTEARVKISMSEYATEFGKFLLENAMFQQRGKLYLKFTDKEIKQIIDNAMKDFENGSTEG